MKSLAYAALAVAAFLAAGPTDVDDGTDSPAPDVSICQWGVPGPCNGDVAPAS